MSRVTTHFTVSGIFLALLHATSAQELTPTVPSWQASPPPIDFQARVVSMSNIGSLLKGGYAWLNDKGFANEVGGAIGKAGPNIESLFTWTQPKGVLIEIPAQVYKVKPEVGTFRSVIGGSVVIHGPGDSVIDALAAHMDRQEQQPGIDDLQPRPSDGMIRSTEWSRYVWVTKQGKNYVLTGYDYDSVTKQALAIRANKSLLESTGKAQDRKYFLNMVDAYSKALKDSAEKVIVQDLRTGANDALRDMDRINAEKRERLQSIASANEAADMLQSMGSILTLASQIGVASRAFGNQTPADITSAKSSADLMKALDAARNRYQQEVDFLQKMYQDRAKIYFEMRSKVIFKLQNSGAPTSYLRRELPLQP